MKASILDGFLFAYLITLSVIFAKAATEDDLIAHVSLYTAIFILAFMLTALLSHLINSRGVKTLGGLIFASAHKKNQHKSTNLFKTFWGWQLIISFVITILVGLHVTQFSLRDLFDEAGFGGAQRIFSSMIRPNWQILPQALLAIIQTIYIAFIATVIAIPVAFILAFFCSKNIVGNNIIANIIYVILRGLLNITRSIEPLIWAIIFSVWVGIGPFAGMLALMLHSVASLTKQYYEIIECVNEGPIEGIQSTGANTIQTIWFAVVPQIILPYISYTIYRWDINVRMATIIGLVGGGGIGTMLIQYQGQALWNEVGTLAFLIIAVVWVMDTASAHIREALK